MSSPAPCPRCGAALAPGQSWCADCGLAARTRLVSSHAWPRVLAGAATLAALALAAAVVSFVLLTADDAPVTTAATTTATTTATPSATPAQQRAQRLKLCVGTVTADVPTYAPTADLARSQGGDGFGATVGGAPVELIVFPTPAAAQVGFKDASDRLIALQQQDPAAYAKVAATQSQVVGTVLEIHPTGQLPPAAAAKVSGCIAASG